MNFKHLTLILLLIFILFSISAVSAGNETAIGNATSESANATIIADNTSSASNASGYTFGNVSYANSSDAPSTPSLQISLVSDEDNPFNQYIDISVSDGDNTVNINNKNFFFSFTQEVNSNLPYKSDNNNNLIDVVLFNRNNSFAFNVNMLNKAHQEAELTAPNFLWDIINKIISAFFSLFK